MKTLAKLVPSIGGLAVACAALLLAPVARATPYASCITNTAGTISFYLNESNADVTVTYNDGSTNASFNGLTTGVGLASGVYSFPLGTFTSYSISVTKTNPSVGVIQSVGRSSSRGVDVNKNPHSPYFGNVYSVQSASTNIFRLNSDLSQITKSGAGVAWSGSSLSPYRIYVASDDFIMAGDGSPTHAGVWRLAPDLSTNQLFLGPLGETNGLNAGVFGTIQSRPLLLGTVAGGNAVLMDVDGDLTPTNNPGGYNDLIIYNIGPGPLPWTNVPTTFGPDIGVQAGLTSEQLGDNQYPGLTQGPNGYIYASTFRNNLSNPLIQIYDSTGTNPVWNSWIPQGTPYPGGTPTADYFLQNINGVIQGIVDSAVSPDGNYIVGVNIDNGFVVAPLTNGIPNVVGLFTVIPTSTTGNARGIAFDAADNVYLSSSGLGLVQEWSLGLSATAITTGNSNGTTGFQLILPSTQASVIPSTNTFASQGGSNGTLGVPITSSFEVQRSSTNGNNFPLVLNFSLTGTAPGSLYTISSPDGIITPGNNGVILAANQTNATIVIAPKTNNVPALPTTVIFTLLGGGSYLVNAPFQDTNFIQNTSSQLIQITNNGSQAVSMYKAFSNDFGSFILQRLGDTNVPAYTVSTYTLTGSAVAGVDYTAPQTITFNPGDILHTNMLFPLSNGVPVVDVPNPPYSGNKSFTVGLGSGGATYATNATTASATIIDNADPPAPILYASPLTSALDATNWHITYGTGDEGSFPTNYEVDFGYDLTGSTPTFSGFNLALPFPPNGASNALRITCNKQANPGAAGGVNVYYTNEAFGGNYAVRFNMNLIEGANPSYTTEGALFGINHGGTYSNWWYGSGPLVSGPWASDGIWFYVTSDPGGGGGGDYQVYTGAGGTNANAGWQQIATANWPTFASIFKVTNVFTTVEGSNGGVPANAATSNGSSADQNWSDVEIKQTHNIITLSIDKTPIFTYANTNTVWTNGFLMLGYEDPYGGTGGISVGTLDAAVYYSNLRVVQLGPPVITSIALTGGNVVIKFTTTDGDDTAASFNLLSSGKAGVAHVDGVAAGATFSQVASNLQFQVTVAKPTNVAQYYRIEHK